MIAIFRRTCDYGHEFLVAEYADEDEALVSRDTWLTTADRIGDDLGLPVAVAGHTIRCAVCGVRVDHDDVDMPVSAVGDAIG
jgi:hypothetical protein